MKAISVVIATIGRDSLEESIKSILFDFSDMKCDFEILVVVDGAVLKESLVNFLNSKSSIRTITLPVRLGPSAAYNRGIELAKGGFIAIFSDDDIWLKGRAHTILEYFSKNKVDILFTRALVCDELKSLERPSSRVNFDNFLLDHYSKPFRIRNPKTILMTTVVAKRGVWEVQLFDEQLHSHEDLWWIQSCATRGFRIEILNQTTVQTNNSILRSKERYSRDSYKWITTLAKYDIHIARVFVFRHLPKLFVFFGDFKGLIEIIRVNKFLRPNYLDLTYFLILFTLTLVMAPLRYLKIIKF